MYRLQIIGENFNSLFLCCLRSAWRMAMHSEHGTGIDEFLINLFFLFFNRANGQLRLIGHSI